ncbi:MAG: hypothetical protein LBU32_20830 [Clostridiales bacterium]|jgi:serine/threonine protein kinase|nr:hypothetical protein [Clostridiales bacterium]
MSVTLRHVSEVLQITIEEAAERLKSWGIPADHADYALSNLDLRLMDTAIKRLKGENNLFPASYGGEYNSALSSERQKSSKAGAANKNNAKASESGDQEEKKPRLDGFEGGSFQRFGAVGQQGQNIPSSATNNATGYIQNPVNGRAKEPNAPFPITRGEYSQASSDGRANAPFPITRGEYSQASSDNRANAPFPITRGEYSQASSDISRMKAPNSPFPASRGEYSQASGDGRTKEPNAPFPLTRGEYSQSPNDDRANAPFPMTRGEYGPSPGEGRAKAPNAPFPMTRGEYSPSSGEGRAKAPNAPFPMTRGEYSPSPGEGRVKAPNAPFPMTRGEYGTSPGEGRAKAPNAPFPMTREEYSPASGEGRAAKAPNAPFPITNSAWDEHARALGTGRQNVADIPLQAAESIEEYAQEPGVIRKLENENSYTESQAELERFFVSYKIFMDASSLMHDGSSNFWKHIVPITKMTGNKVIIPTRVVEELKEFSLTGGQASKKAAEVLRGIYLLAKDELIEIRREQSDNIEENAFQSIFVKFRLRNRLLLIAQDKELAADIESLNDSLALNVHRVQVRKLNRQGYLIDVNLEEEPVIEVEDVSIKLEAIEEESANSKARSSAAWSVSEKALGEHEMFEPPSVLATIPDEQLKASPLPGEGDEVYAQRGAHVEKLRLEKVLAIGGEGIVYTTNTPYVVKIYKRENIRLRKLEKIKLFLSKDLKCKGICFPKAVIYNENRQFVGFMMQKASGRELQKSMFIKPILLKNYPTWKRRDLVELCTVILEKIKYLHDRNIIIGDINTANILVASTREVYFLNTDSYQLEGFPCTKGTVNYTAPEIQRRNFNVFLRSIGNENFAVATLLFMILLPGKPPYSQHGGVSPIENIINMDFQYQLAEPSGKRAPDGPWRFIWSHLSFDIKEAFYQTFRKDGENSLERDRLNAGEWLLKLKWYQYLLDSGKLGMQDQMSEELFPTRYKVQKVSYIECVLCNREVPEESSRNGICLDCLDLAEIYACVRCGKKLEYTNYQRYVQNMKRSELCPECLEFMANAFETRVCADCGDSFDISNSEHKHYSELGYELPDICPACRKIRQTAMVEEAADRHEEPGAYQDEDAEEHEDAKSSQQAKPPAGSKKNCFITSTVCGWMNKPDDCYELRVLRDYRDGWLAFQPGGRELIASYYAIGPAIVEKLEESPLYSQYCKDIWETCLKPCLRLIEESELEACKEKYIEMVDWLRNVFLGD